MFLYATFILNDELCAIGTVHLESLDSREERKGQLQVIYNT